MKFNIDKMRLFINEDLLIERIFEDLVSNDIPEEEALEIVFNYDVLNDSEMEVVYENL